MDAKGILGDYYGRNTKRLFKTFLILLEDLKIEHDEKKMQHLRKKVLDMGNENIRSNDDDLEKFTIEFEFKK